jgi:hypothetical protein
MFLKLTDFGYQRCGKEALGFYIAYLFLIILLGGLLGLLYGLVVGDSSFETGVVIGNVLAVVVCLGIGNTIAKAKGEISYQTILLTVLSGILAVLFGGMGGLIPLAYMTTLENNA